MHPLPAKVKRGITPERTRGQARNHSWNYLYGTLTFWIHFKSFAWSDICGSAYRQNVWTESIIKNPRWYKQHIYETVFHMTNVTERSHTSEIWILEVFFVVFRMMKIIILNKTERSVGRNTSNYACQIFCSKSNWNYVSLIFPPKDNCGQNNEQSECLLRP